MPRFGTTEDHSSLQDEEASNDFNIPARRQKGPAGRNRRTRRGAVPELWPADVGHARRYPAIRSWNSVSARVRMQPVRGKEVADNDIGANYAAIFGCDRALSGPFGEKPGGELLAS